MPGSSRKINYTLRPAKHIERKMIAEAMAKLSTFARLDSYRYIGFGAYYFSDFLMVHRALGVNKLISIEGDPDGLKRYNFNKPFTCVSIKRGMSRDVLNSISWTRRTILWLDYDHPLNDDVLADVTLFASHARSGSMIIVTVDAQTEGYEFSREDYYQLLPARQLTALARSRELFTKPLTEIRRLISASDMEAAARRKLQEVVGQGIKLPHLNPDVDMVDWGIASLFYGIINDRIKTTINDRNGNRNATNAFSYKQIFNFHYRDSAKMLTLGGVIYDQSEKPHFEACDFSHGLWFRDGKEPIRIEVPKLTVKEIKALESQMPLKINTKLRSNGIPTEDIDAYCKYYRYFPTFGNVEI